MTKKYPNCIFIITGTSRGVGRALAQHYLQNHQEVIGLSRSVSTIEHDHYRHHCVDIKSEEQVQDFFNANSEKLEDGRLVLINNAGIASMNHFILSTGTMAKEIMETNFIGPFFMMRAAARVMKKTGGGRIINISTVAVPLALAGESLYSASKSALEQFTRVTAKEVSSWGITVNNLGLGPFKSDLIKNISEKKIDAVLDQQSIRRWTEIQDITQVVDFFSSERSDFITGQTIYLGGVS